MLAWIHRDHNVRCPKGISDFVPEHLVYLDASASMYIPEGKTDSIVDWDAENWEDWRKQSVDRSAPCWVHVGKKVLEQAVPLLHKSKVECAIFGDGPAFRLQYKLEEFEDHFDEVADTWSRCCLGGTLLWQRIARDIDRMFPGEPSPGEKRETQLMIITDGYDTDSKAQYRGLMGCRQLAQDLARKQVDAEIHIISLGISSVEVLDEYQQLTGWSGGSCYAVNDIEDHSGLEETLKDFSVYVLEDAEHRQKRRTEKRALYFRKYGSQSAYPRVSSPVLSIPEHEEERAKTPSRPPSPAKSTSPDLVRTSPEVPDADDKVSEKNSSRAASPQQRSTMASPQPDAAQATPDASPQHAEAASTHVASRPQSAAKDSGGPADSGEVKSLQEMAQIERIERMKELQLASRNSTNSPNSAPPPQVVQSSVEEQQKLSEEADRLRSFEESNKSEQEAVVDQAQADPTLTAEVPSGEKLQES
jgi:hypothetical protein